MTLNAISRYSFSNVISDRPTGCREALQAPRQALVMYYKLVWYYELNCLRVVYDQIYNIFEECGTYQLNIGRYQKYTTRRLRKFSQSLSRARED